MGAAGKRPSGANQKSLAVPSWLPALGSWPSGASACPRRAERTADRANIGPVYRVPRLASPQPCRAPGTGSTTPCREVAPLTGASTSLVRALALHGVARHRARQSTGRLRSHLASPLEPGRGVLIRSVSRRLGSVACVREDASPNEVSLSTTSRMPHPRCKSQFEGAQVWNVHGLAAAELYRLHDEKQYRDHQITAKQ